jgi:hypothetical protein
LFLVEETDMFNGKALTRPQRDSNHCRLHLEPLEARNLLAVHIGAMGDSYTAITSPLTGIPNWVEELAAGGRADFGPLGTYVPPDPRSVTGMAYEYDFAVPGASTTSMTGCGNFQQTGCATGGAPRFRAYATSGRLDFGVLEIAGNDFIQHGILEGKFLIAPFPLWRDGFTLLNQTLNSYLNDLNLATANGTAPVHMMLANLADLSTYPLFAGLPQAAKDNLRTWIIAWNNAITVEAAAHSYGVWDLWSAWENFRNRGGETIHGIFVKPDAWDGNGGPQDIKDFFINDGLHPSPIGHAVLANQFLADLNARYGTNIPLLTDKEMVTLSLLDPELPPIADAGGPYVINPGDSLTLDASRSTDPNPGDIPYLQFSWDLEGDGGFDDATGVTPTLSWDQLTALGIQPGNSYTIQVRVDDTYGGVTDSDPVTLTVSGDAPGARRRLGGDIFRAMAGAPATGEGMVPTIVSQRLVGHPSSFDR